MTSTALRSPERRRWSMRTRGGSREARRLGTGPRQKMQAYLPVLPDFVRRCWNQQDLGDDMRDLLVCGCGYVFPALTGKAHASNFARFPAFSWTNRPCVEQLCECLQAGSKHCKYRPGYCKVRKRIRLADWAYTKPYTTVRGLSQNLVSKTGPPCKHNTFITHKHCIFPDHAHGSVLRDHYFIILADSVCEITLCSQAVRNGRTITSSVRMCLRTTPVRVIFLGKHNTFYHKRISTVFLGLLSVSCSWERAAGSLFIILADSDSELAWLRTSYSYGYGGGLFYKGLCSNQWPQYYPGWDREGYPHPVEITAHSWAKRPRCYVRLQASGFRDGLTLHTCEGYGYERAYVLPAYFRLQGWAYFTYVWTWRP
jgi:hypothetical protein